MKRIHQYRNLIRIGVMLLSILLICLGYWGKNEQHKIDLQNQREETKVMKAKSKYQQAYKKAQREQNMRYLIKKAKGNNDQSDNANQLLLSQQLSSVANNAFSVICTYQDLASWRARNSEVLAYVTPDVVKNNKGFFNSGKDQFGQDAVSNLNVTSWFVDSTVYANAADVKNHQITGLAVVKFASQNRDYTPGEITFLAHVTMDTKQQKLTEMTVLGWLDNKPLRNGDYHNVLNNPQ